MNEQSYEIAPQMPLEPFKTIGEINIYTDSNNIFYAKFPATKGKYYACLRDGFPIGLRSRKEYEQAKINNKQKGVF